MKSIQTWHLLVFTVAACLTFSCNRFTVDNVDYSQQIESVLVPDSSGIVMDNRYALSFNINPFLQKEFGDVDSAMVDEIRLIRNKSGYYYITASGFKHIYVMEPQKSSLKLIKRLKIDEEPLKAPALNLREGNIQLVNRESGDVYIINHNRIQ